MKSLRGVLVAIVIAALTACGTTSTTRGDQNTDYVLISIFEAGGIYKILRGDWKGCKLTMHGTLPAFALGFDGERCEVTADK